MELTRRKGEPIISVQSQRGMSLLELMIAMTVLVIGILGTMVLVLAAIGSNGRNRQGSNSTAIAQMVTEKLLSVTANTSPTVNLTDCASNTASINTTGSVAGTGAALLSSGDADFSQALGGAGVPSGYYLSYTDCATGGQAIYDVRWNIQSPSTNVKLITVSAKMWKAGNDLKIFAPPVTIHSMAGR